LTVQATRGKPVIRQFAKVRWLRSGMILPLRHGN